MTSPNAREEILNFAIRNEDESFRFYTGIANTTDKPHMRLIFEKFAIEEKEHKVKLEKIKKDGTFATEQKNIMDLKISDYISDEELNPEMEYQHALVIAMKHEKKAFQLYTNLAEIAVDDTTRNLFRFLAQEEAKHKLRFEIEYDEEFMKDN